MSKRSCTAEESIEDAFCEWTQAELLREKPEYEQKQLHSRQKVSQMLFSNGTIGMVIHYKQNVKKKD